jgi:hypothetical protein
LTDQFTMADKLKLEPLIARRTALWGEQEGFKAYLYYKKGPIKPAESERDAFNKASRAWFEFVQASIRNASWELPEVAAERDRLVLEESKAQVAYDIARLGEDAGKAYQLVLDELKQIGAEMDKIYRSIATIPRN